MAVYSWLQLVGRVLRAHYHRWTTASRQVDGQADRIVYGLEAVVIDNVPRFDRELVLEAHSRITTTLVDGLVALYRETLIGLGALAEDDEDEDEESEGETT